MGKRELLLILGFIAVGVVVYQITAPPSRSGDSVMSAGRRVLDEIRREIRGRPASAELTVTGTHPVPSGTTELRVTLRNSPVTIVGEDRADIASELWVRSNGVDEAEARDLAGRAVLKVEPAGPTVSVAVTLPEEGTQRVRLSLRVPSSLLVQFGQTNTQIDVTGVGAVELEGARGETTIRRIPGRVGITHRGGDLVVEDVGSVRLNARGSDVRLARVAGETALDIQSGDVRAGELLGAVEIEAENGDVTLEHLQKSPGPFRIRTFDGTLSMRGLRAEARIDGRDTDIDITIDDAAAIAVFNSGERIQLTPPPGGFTLDAVATGGTIRVAESLAADLAVTGAPDGKAQRAAGRVRGGGPTITLRSTAGEIRVNAREP